MKIIVSENSSRMEGSKSHILPIINYTGTWTSEITLKARPIPKIDDLSGAQMLKTKSLLAKIFKHCK